ncbi:MAG: recombination protein O N-terminal domain-containing protein [Patescibacteria group bacterium]|nr:recombination protein O N-terminal domain-containing protein [Patescibacteria group bacterium]
MYVRREVTTEGIVLSRHATGEGSLRILLYTQELGLASVLAKSAREERSKLRPHLQVGSRAMFTLVKGKDVWRVTGATSSKNFHFVLQAHAPAQRALARVIMSVRQFVHGEGANRELYAAVRGFFDSVAAMPELADAAETLAVLRILAALGYVRENETTRNFLTNAYDSSVLSLASRARRPLVHAINEAISASGL